VNVVEPVKANPRFYLPEYVKFIARFFTIDNFSLAKLSQLALHRFITALQTTLSATSKPRAKPFTICFVL
jgi:hypothetical protein